MTSGQITGVLAGVATILAAFGQSDLAGLLGSPFLAHVAAGLPGLAAIVAGHLPGAKKA